MSDAGADRAFIERAIRLGIIGAVTLVVVLGLAWLLKAALTPLAVAWVIAYLCDPLIDRFEARGIPRSAAIGLLLLGFGAALFGTAFLLIPAMLREMAALSESLPGYVDAALASVAPWLREHLGVALPATVHEALDALRGESALPLDAARSLLERVLRTITGTAGALVSLLIIPVIAFYLLVEFDRIGRAVLDLVPRGYRDAVAARAARVDGLVSSFIRGQLTICLVLGALYAGGFAAIGIQLAFVIGVVSGLLAIIPYVGGAVAFASAAGMCLLQYGFDAHLVAVVVWYALVQGFEGMLLTPRIMGQSLGMHPVTVILALMIGADLLGFLGLMIAVPTAAVVQVFAGELIALYRSTDLYGGGGPAAPTG